MLRETSVAKGTFCDPIFNCLLERHCLPPVRRNLQKKTCNNIRLNFVYVVDAVVRIQVKTGRCTRQYLQGQGDVYYSMSLLVGLKAELRRIQYHPKFTHRFSKFLLHKVQEPGHQTPVFAKRSKKIHMFLLIRNPTSGL